MGGGFEPPKAEPTDLQSVPFGHSGTPPFCTFGADTPNRTEDILITSETLYQLSYIGNRFRSELLAPVFRKRKGKNPHAGKKFSSGNPG